MLPTRTSRLGRPTSIAAAVAAGFLAPQLLAAEDPNLFDMSLEQLVNLEVTSVSAKSERLSETTSAVYVITRDDIVRYGIRSIPEALRLAPGLSVLQIDANKWAIGSRGDTGRFSNKLLVLMDGRLLYTPAFSGVFWDVQDTHLDDIARIEVIRGPGATIWGANAVNGVINIITRDANRADGGSVTTRVEDDGTYLTAASFSSDFTERADFRVFVKHQDTDGNRDTLGQASGDAWQQSRAGFRTDWSPRAGDTLTFTSEFFRGDMGMAQQFNMPTPPYVGRRDINADVSGSFAIGRWAHESAPNARSSLQLTLDFSNRDSPQYSEKRDTHALDFRHQHTFARHDLVAGASYRANSYDLGGSDGIVVLTQSPSDWSASVFIQDEFALVPEKLRLTFGTKLEHNELSTRSLDAMPTVRLLWKPQGETSVWAAVTRALRMPSYGESGAGVLDIAPVIPPGSANNPFPLPMYTMVTGTPDFAAEEVVAREIGIRGRLAPRASYDLALYRSAYDDIRANAPVDVVCRPSGISVLADPLCILGSDGLVTAVRFVNGASGHYRGLELAVDWDVTDAWRLRGTYTHADESLDTVPPVVALPQFTPEAQIGLRSEWSINSRIRLATWVRHIQKLDPLSIDAYWQADLQLNWEPSAQWRLAAGGRNLLGNQLEFISELNDVVPTEIERLFYFTAQLRF